MELQLIDELITLLEQEIKVYENILRLSKDKTNIVIQGKVSELENIVKLEQSLVLQIGRIENLRESLVDKISAQLKVKPSDLTISELLNNIPPEKARKLKACQDNLVSTISDMKSTNELNAKLIKNSLEYINFSINLLTSTEVGTNNYGNSGEVRDVKKRNLFDMKL